MSGQTETDTVYGAVIATEEMCESLVTCRCEERCRVSSPPHAHVLLCKPEALLNHQLLGFLLACIVYSFNFLTYSYIKKDTI